MRVGALIERNANINPTSFTQILESPDILLEMPKLLALPWGEGCCKVLFNRW